LRNKMTSVKEVREMCSIVFINSNLIGGRYF
jgi:hypothetical protein